jgi:hypothetical protein
MGKFSSLLHIQQLYQQWFFLQGHNGISPVPYLFLLTPSSMHHQCNSRQSREEREETVEQVGAHTKLLLSLLSFCPKRQSKAGSQKQLCIWQPKISPWGLGVVMTEKQKGITPKSLLLSLLNAGKI